MLMRRLFPVQGRTIHYQRKCPAAKRSSSIGLLSEEDGKVMACNVIERTDLFAGNKSNPTTMALQHK
jgi:hypothetical protein